MAMVVAVRMRVTMGMGLKPRRPRVPMRVIAAVPMSRMRRVIVVSIRRVLIAHVRRVIVRHLARGRILMLMRMSMSPQHELLDNEEHPEPDHKRDTDPVRAPGSNALHCFR